MDLEEPPGLLVVARSVVRVTMARALDAFSDLHREMFSRSGVLLGAGRSRPLSPLGAGRPRPFRLLFFVLAF